MESTSSSLCEYVRRKRDYDAGIFFNQSRKRINVFEQRLIYWGNHIAVDSD